MKNTNSISKDMNTGNNAGSKFLTAGTLTAAGTIAAVSIGGYFLWRNRTKVMSFLKEAGVPEAWMDGHLGESIKAEAVKIGGVLKTELKNDLGKLGFASHNDSDKDMNKDSNKDSNKDFGKDSKSDSFGKTDNKNDKSGPKKFDSSYSSAV